VAALGFFMRWRPVRQRDHACHCDDLAEIRVLDGRPQPDVMAELRDRRAVEIPESIALPEQFAPLSASARARYFEWREIVFRVAQDNAGLCTVSIRNDEDAPATPGP
jgi:hypothetical protein